MNLLLYAEARISLSRQRGAPALHDTTPVRANSLWGNVNAMTLPDSLFEELGYYGALESPESPESGDKEGDDAFEELFRTWGEPALTR